MDWIMNKKHPHSFPLRLSLTVCITMMMDDMAIYFTEPYIKLLSLEK